MAPWINCDSYVDEYFSIKILKQNEALPERPEILNYNRHNYGMVEEYIKYKETTRHNCYNDPLFKPIPVLSAKKKFSVIKALPTGKEENSDRKYEEVTSQLMASLLYPYLDFAEIQSRSDSGVLIRDLIFYNNRNIDFLSDIYKNYDSRQLVFEMKNVQEVTRDHINQLNRYLNNEFGRFGILLTRINPPKKIIRNVLDLWSGQRKCIIFLTDEHVSMMVELFDSKTTFTY